MRRSCIILVRTTSYDTINSHYLLVKRRTTSPSCVPLELYSTKIKGRTIWELYNTRKVTAYINKVIRAMSVYHTEFNTPSYFVRVQRTDAIKKKARNCPTAQKATDDRHDTWTHQQPPTRCQPVVPSKVLVSYEYTASVAKIIIIIVE